MYRLLCAVGVVAILGESGQTKRGSERVTGGVLVWNSKGTCVFVFLSILEKEKLMWLMTHVVEYIAETCDFYLMHYIIKNIFFFFFLYYFSIWAVAVEGSKWSLLLPVFFCWTETCTVFYVVLHANVKILKAKFSPLQKVRFLCCDLNRKVLLDCLCLCRSQVTAHM